MKSAAEVLDRLCKVDRLVKGPLRNRILSCPSRYLYGIGFRELIYPFRQKGINAVAKTVFGEDLVCPLPGALDIYLFGAKTHDSEIRLAKFFINHIKNCSRFVDVGAHIGYFSLLVDSIAKRSGIESESYSVEPSARNFALLKQNAAAFKSVHPFNLAMNDESHLASFYEFPDKYAEFNSMDLDQYKTESWFQKVQFRKTDIESVTLDEFAIQEAINPTLIKIDVEGAEHKVIKGGRETLTNCRPIVVMEFLTSDRRNSGHRAAHELLHTLGYHSFRIDPNGETVTCRDPLVYLQSSQLDSDNIVYKPAA